MNLVISTIMKDVTQAFLYFLASGCPYIGPSFPACNEDTYNYIDYIKYITLSSELKFNLEYSEHSYN
jgi:hypothetical protein